jgi:hypothetical protein
MKIGLADGAARAAMQSGRNAAGIIDLPRAWARFVGETAIATTFRTEPPPNLAGILGRLVGLILESWGAAPHGEAAPAFCYTEDLEILAHAASAALAPLSTGLVGILLTADAALPPEIASPKVLAGGEHGYFSIYRVCAHLQSLRAADRLALVINAALLRHWFLTGSVVDRDAAVARVLDRTTRPAEFFAAVDAWCTKRVPGPLHTMSATVDSMTNFMCVCRFTQRYPNGMPKLCAMSARSAYPPDD